MKKERKFLPTLNELIDRLSIHQLKEVFIPENKENYATEIKDISVEIIERKQRKATKLRFSYRVDDQMKFEGF